MATVIGVPPLKVDPRFPRCAGTEVKYKAWARAGRCYACGAPATHQVTLKWMGENGRPYCRLHAAEWARAGWPQFVTRRP